jgi:biopolymer transport protein ExbD
MPKVQPVEHDAPASRRGRARRVTSSLAEINVVPLVDVMLVLLIIFMVTAPMMQRGVDVSLPTSVRAQQISEERIFVSVPLSYRKDRLVWIGDEPIRVEILNERMRQAMQNRTGREVYLRGDGGIRLQELIEVMDRLKEGGVEKVGIVSKLPGER